MIFADPNEVQRAYASGRLICRRVSKCAYKETLNSYDEETKQTRIVDTTVGRALLWEIVPEGMPLT